MPCYTSDGGAFRPCRFFRAFARPRASTCCVPKGRPRVETASLRPQARLPLSSCCAFPILHRNPDFKPSLPVPSASTSAAAYGAHMGISGNLRYQLLYGLDRVLQQNFNHIPVAILGTTALR